MFGLPGGNCNANGYFLSFTEYGYFWSSSEYDTDYAWGRILNNHDTKVIRDNLNKHYGLSVRCLRD